MGKIVGFVIAFFVGAGGVWILHGQRGVTANTALRLARYFGTTPQVWLNLKKTCELRRAEIAVGRRIAAGVKPRHTAV